MKNKKNENGMMLITIIMLTFLMIMLTTAMITIVSTNLNITGQAELKSKALTAAEAGIEYAFYQLSNDSTWGDPALNPIFNTDMTEAVGDGQEFTLIFDPNKTVRTVNNLTNNSPSGQIPAYSAQIICEGRYKEYKQTIRAIFVRDDMFTCPIISEGQMDINLPTVLSGLDIYSEKEDGVKGPARVHSNSDVTMSALAGGIDLEEGYVSSCSTITTAPSVKEKSPVLPEKITEIDISDIILSNSAGALTLDDDVFYLVGFFEFDGNSPAYCIPHSAPDDKSADPQVYGPYSVGVAAISPETDCDNFLDNYGDFYNAGPRLLPSIPPLIGGAPTPDSARNFFDYGYSIDFKAYPVGGTASEISAYNTALINDIGMSMHYDSGTNDITLTMERDIIVNTVNGFFATDYIWEGTTGGYYFPVGMAGSDVRLNFNDHNILGNKVYMAIPSAGTGAIISEETIDYMHTEAAEISLLSNKSVRMVVRDDTLLGPYGLWPLTTPAGTYRGIIYARDDIMVQNVLTAILNAGKWDIEGAMVCRGEDPNSCGTSPMAANRIGINPASNMSIPPACFMLQFALGLNIAHTYDGLDTVAILRGTNFKVRKQFLEIIN